MTQPVIILKQYWCIAIGTLLFGILLTLPAAMESDLSGTMLQWYAGQQVVVYQVDANGQIFHKGHPFDPKTAYDTIRQLHARCGNGVKNYICSDPEAPVSSLSFLFDSYTRSTGFNDFTIKSSELHGHGDAIHLQLSGCSLGALGYLQIGVMKDRIILRQYYREEDRHLEPQVFHLQAGDPDLSSAAAAISTMLAQSPRLIIYLQYGPDVSVGTYCKVGKLIADQGCSIDGIGTYYPEFSW